MRPIVTGISGICILGIVIASLQLLRSAPRSSRSEWERLAAYDLKNGKEDAKADLRRGTPKWITYGFPPFDTRSYGPALRSKLGLKAEQIAACTVPPGARRYTEEYNREIFDYLVKLYGEEYVSNELSAVDIFPGPPNEEANQPSEPTAMSVTSPAAQEPRQP